MQEHARARVLYINIERNTITRKTQAQAAAGWVHPSLLQVFEGLYSRTCPHNPACSHAWNSCLICLQTSTGVEETLSKTLILRSNQIACAVNRIRPLIRLLSFFGTALEIACHQIAGVVSAVGVNLCNRCESRIAYQTSLANALSQQMNPTLRFLAAERALCRMLHPSPLQSVCRP